MTRIRDLRLGDRLGHNPEPQPNDPDPERLPPEARVLNLLDSSRRFGASSTQGALSLSRQLMQGWNR